MNDLSNETAIAEETAESRGNHGAPALDAAALALIPPRLRPRPETDGIPARSDGSETSKFSEPEGSPDAGSGAFDWTSLKPEDTATGLVPEKLARAHRAFPARAEGRRLTVVMADPGDYVAIRNLEARTRMEVLPVQGDPTEIVRAIDVHYSAQMPDEVVQALDAKFASGSRGDEGEVIREIPLVREEAHGDSEDDETSPIIAAVDSLIAQAVMTCPLKRYQGLC
ncbi:MAG: hypothetical protein QF554_14070 [Dehalococcoidia bacterium]|jgi:hypothetical protein|nr:hypothetical protein [Dehalococcoidia bacterium]